MSSKKLNLDDRFLAYDGINCEIEFFSTLQEAQEHLESVFLDTEEGYHPDLSSCKIYKLYETVDYHAVDSKENYKYMYEEDIPEDDEVSEACPFGGADYDEIWKHDFIKIK